MIYGLYKVSQERLKSNVQIKWTEENKKRITSKEVIHGLSNVSYHRWIIHSDAWKYVTGLSDPSESSFIRMTGIEIRLYWFEEQRE